MNLWILQEYLFSLLIPRCKGFVVVSGIPVNLMELLEFTYKPHFDVGICEKNVLIP